MRGFGPVKRSYVVFKTIKGFVDQRSSARTEVTASSVTILSAMKCLITLAALFGVSLAQYWGLPHPVRDLPEVVAAREEHLAAVAAIRKGGHYVPKPLPIHYAPQHHYEEPQKKWTGPIALPPGYDKHGAPLPVVDLPEVAAEKAKHLHLYGYGPHAGAVAAAAAGRYAESHSAPIWTHNGPHQPHYSHPQTHPLY